MANQSIMLKASGLNTNFQSLMEVPPGALLQAKNVVINRDGIIESRRGLDLYYPLKSSANPADDALFVNDSSIRAKQLLEYKNNILVHGSHPNGYNYLFALDNTFGEYRYSPVATTGFPSVDPLGDGKVTNQINSFSSSYRMRSEEAKGNFYFTTDSGVKKISSQDEASFEDSFVVEEAGLPQALAPYGYISPPTGSSGFLTVSNANGPAKVAYRILWVKTDRNSNLLFGAPSPRVVVSNTSASVISSVTLHFPRPVEINSNNFNQYKFRVYRSEILNSSTAEPSDELYMVYEGTPTSPSSTYLAYIDSASETARLGGVPLYTNANSGEGILKANNRPPSAQDISTFKGHMFYGNTKTRHSLTTTLSSLSNLNVESDITISDGTIAGTSKYTFVSPNKSQNVITFTGTATFASYSNRYITLNSPNNNFSYSFWFDPNSTPSATPSDIPAFNIPVRVNISAFSAQTSFTLSSSVAAAFNTEVNKFAASSTGLPAIFTSTAATSTVAASTVTVNNINFGTSKGAAYSGISTEVTFVLNTIVTKQVTSVPITSTTIANYNGAYLSLYSANNSTRYAFWFDTTGVSTVPSAISADPLTFGVRVNISALTTTAQIATALYNAINAFPFDFTIPAPAGSTLTITNTNAGACANPFALINSALFTVQKFVRAASTANIASLATAPAVIDTVNLVAGDRILLKDQTTANQNGIYVFSAAGSPLVRATDSDTYAEMMSNRISVSEGALNTSTTFYTDTSGTGTINVTSIPISTIITSAVTTSGVGDYSIVASPQQTQISLLSGIRGDYLDGYIKIFTSDNTSRYAFWFDTTGTATAPSSIASGFTPIRVNIGSSTTITQIGTALLTALNSTLGAAGLNLFTFSFLSTLNTPSNYVILMNNIINGPAINVVTATNKIQISTIEGTSPNKQILIGSTIEETAKSLVRAINITTNSKYEALYISNFGEVAGKIFIQKRNIDSLPFILCTEDYSSRLAFSPNLGFAVPNSNLTIGNSTTVTTSQFMGLNYLDNIFIYGASKLIGVQVFDSEISGLNILPTAPTNSLDSTQYTINKKTSDILNSPGYTVFLALTSSIRLGNDAGFKSSSESIGNRLYYSKYQEHEAVPLLNYIDIGSRDQQILRIIQLRESLFVLKEDGVYRLAGDPGANPIWDVGAFDTTSIIKAPDTAITLGNQCYFLSNQGVMQLNESSIQSISRPIDNRILPLITTNNNLPSLSFSVSYESDKSFLMWTVSTAKDTKTTICYRYNYVTNAWTEWTLSKTCGLVSVHNDKMFLGSGTDNYIEIERKNFSRFDYADRELVGYSLTAGALGNATISNNTLFTTTKPGDVCSQTQYVSFEEFNRLLSSLDYSYQTNSKDYLEMIKLNKGDDLLNNITLLMTKLQADEGFLFSSYSVPFPASDLTFLANYAVNPLLALQSKYNEIVYVLRREFDNLDNDINFFASTYSNIVTYTQGDIVQYSVDGNYYRYILNIPLSGNLPTDTTFWESYTPTLRPPTYNNSTAYQIGNLVSYTADTYFRCAANSTGNPPPSTTPLEWDFITSYSIGNIVSYNGIYYRCTASNTGTVPTNTSFWAVNYWQPYTPLVITELKTLNTGFTTLTGYVPKYKVSSGFRKYEAMITGLNNVSKLVEFETTPSFMIGPFTVLQSIPVELEYAPQHIGDPASSKQFSVGTFMFEKKSFTSAEIAYNNDISDNYEEVPITLNSYSTFGAGSWGEGTWGGSGDQSQLRTYIPLRKQRCRFLGCKFIHSGAMEFFRLYGLSLSYRVYAIADRDFK